MENQSLSELSLEQRLLVIEKLMEKAENMDSPMLKETLQELLQDTYREIDAEIFFRDNKRMVV